MPSRIQRKLTKGWRMGPMKRTVRKGGFMKRMVEKTFCDTPGCGYEAEGVCSNCQKDICCRHRAWLSTTFRHGPYAPGHHDSSFGFNLCYACLDKFEGVFKDHQHRGDGYGPMPKQQRTDDGK